ncbi:hypothetical protein HUU40_14060, partial [candidate division KSB1 bacterium]|nr:hypothetical protein [candidate division KSB1 bacterium]
FADLSGFYARFFALTFLLRPLLKWLMIFVSVILSAVLLWHGLHGLGSLMKAAERLEENSNG